MNFEEIGKWKGYSVMLGGSTHPLPHDGRIYLSPTDYGYDMFLDNVYVGWCDAKYRVQEYTGPKPTCNSFVSWHNHPEPEQRTSTPEQKTSEPEPQPAQKKTTPVPVSTDFWSSLQEDIASTLNGVKLIEEKAPQTEPKPAPKQDPRPSSKPLFRFDFQ